jgi:hypothetical protein
MLSLVLVTPVYAESGSEAGMFTHALASCLTQHGHRVIVVCSHAATACPSHAESGRLWIQRLSAKRQNRQRSFATLALSRVSELTQTDRCDRIISIDADPFSILAASTIGNRPLLDIQTEQLDPESTLPLTGDAWQPPCFNRHVLLGTASSDESQDQLIDAYHSSYAPTLGWSLAVPDPNGEWRIVCSAQSPRSGNEAIFVPMRPGPSVLAEIATAHGIASVAYDDHRGDVPRLTRSLNSALEVDTDQRRTSALEQWKRKYADTQMRARSEYWNQYVADVSSHTIGRPLHTWLRLERSGKAVSAAGGTI